MILPKLVHSLLFTVHGLRKIVSCQMSDVNCRVKHGFTLIELLVVITIIAILVGAGTVSWSNAQQKGRDARRKADIKAIQQALELYFQDNKYYPPWTMWFGWCHPTSSDVFKNILEPKYIKELPVDPLSPQQDYYYYYGWYVYELEVVLENTNDPEYGTYNTANKCKEAWPAAPDTYNYRATPP